MNFFGHTGARREGPVVPLSASFGCGGGVIDFDLDGCSDLYLSAAGDKIRTNDNESGALFRLLGDADSRRFVNTTAFAGLLESRFGQGVAVGDYNSDGFPDLYLLNFGDNRLYQNNGDGTFTDISERVGIADVARWSTSGAIADFNQDGLADLIALNYAEYDSNVDKDCFEKDGKLRMCFPVHYAAEKNQYFLARGDGTFDDVSDKWTSNLRPGRSLGLILGRIDSKRMGAFIANDMSENQLHVFANDSDPSDDALENLAMTAGIALDGTGNAQASMGIATTDFNGDGKIDFFVTGFSNEYNILYEQTVSGFWTDQTSKASLIAPTFDRVSFGTKACDFDNDGLDELIVANGHVSEFNLPQSPYAQFPDLFRVDLDKNQWHRVEFDGSGYMTKRHVGRSLFLIDASGDGRSDVVVTHMTEPVCLLINQTQTNNRSVRFELVGRQCHRDAVGTLVTFEVSSKKTDLKSPLRRTLQRLAGTGFCCSSDPILRAGTGSATKIQNVQIDWPSGLTQTIDQLETDAHYLIVEGEPPYKRSSSQ